MYTGKPITGSNTYAPVSSTNPQELEKFWETARGVLDLADANERIIICGDLNGWVGTKRSSYETVLGPCGDKRVNDAVAWHRPQSAASLQEEELMQKSARALVSTTDPLEKLRLLCLSRGATGIMQLCRIFRRMDVMHGHKQLNKQEFINCICETGLELSIEEAEELFKKFDTDNTGSISLDNMLLQIRPPMSDARRAVVEQVFRKLDKTGDCMITIADIRSVYSVNSHPRYMSGEETADLVLNRFLANFETGGTVDGKVTLEEFMNYYSGISVSIDNDPYFNLMMRQGYNL